MFHFFQIQLLVKLLRLLGCQTHQRKLAFNVKTGVMGEVVLHFFNCSLKESEQQDTTNAY